MKKLFMLLLLFHVGSSFGMEKKLRLIIDPLFKKKEIVERIVNKPENFKQFLSLSKTSQAFRLAVYSYSTKNPLRKEITTEELKPQNFKKLLDDLSSGFFYLDLKFPENITVEQTRKIFEALMGESHFYYEQDKETHTIKYKVVEADFGFCKITDDHLLYIPTTIKRLDLTYNKKITDKGFKHFVNVTPKPPIERYTYSLATLISSGEIPKKGPIILPEIKVKEPPFTNLPILIEYLDVADIKELTGKDLHKLTELEVLIARFSSLTDDAVKKLKKLKILDITFVKNFTGKPLDPIKNLEELHYEGSGITKKTLYNLRKLNPKIVLHPELGPDATPYEKIKPD